MKSTLQVSVITLSALSVVGLGLGGYGLYAKYQQTDLLGTFQEDHPPLNVSARLSKGDQFFAVENYAEAAKEYGYATQLDPSSPEAFLKAGTASSALNQNELALEQFKTAYTLESNARTSAAYAHELMLAQQWDMAQEILKNSPEATQELLYTQGLWSLMQDQSEDAEAHFREAAGRTGTIADTTLKSFLQAYETYQAAQDSEPNYLNALLCKALIDAKEYGLTAQLASRVLEKKPDYRDVWVLLGYAKYKMQSYEAAEAAFKQAKKIDSLKPEVHYFLGSTYAQEAKHAQAVDELELALLYGFNPAQEVYKKIAESHEALNEWNEAVAAHEALLALTPTSVNDFEKPIILCLTQLNDKDRALTLAQKAITLFPSEALSHTLLAKVYLAQGDLDLADASISTAFNKNANHPLAHYTAGAIREAQGNKEGALWEYKKTFELTEEIDPLHQQSAEKYNTLLTSNPNMP